MGLNMLNIGPLFILPPLAWGWGGNDHPSPCRWREGGQLTKMVFKPGATFPQKGDIGVWNFAKTHVWGHTPTTLIFQCPKCSPGTTEPHVP